MIKALIVDDEKPARDLIQNLLRTYFDNQIVVAGQAASVVEATDLIDKLQPQLVFLDITMPQENGFELFAKDITRNFEVIFVTAHNDFAIKAIKHSALDYLLKPIDVDEFEESVQKAIQKIAQPPFSKAEQLESLIAHLKGNVSTSVWIQSEREAHRINANDVLYCEADGAYCHLFLENGSQLTCTKTLKDIEALFESANFFRSHRSYLVNMDKVNKIIKGDNWEMILQNGTQVPVSARKRTAVTDALFA